MINVNIFISRLPHNLDLPLPRYETSQSAGMDLQAAVQNTVVIQPGERGLVPTGLKLKLGQDQDWH
jgi:dUTP pyrophosphatase